MGDKYKYCFVSQVVIQTKSFEELTVISSYIYIIPKHELEYTIVF